MKLKADWLNALAAAQAGDTGPARAARLMDGEGGLADYFFAGCLAEAGVDLEEAISALRRARETHSNNPLIPHALALALLRSRSAGAYPEVIGIWGANQLPHDLDLLGQAALELEAQLRNIRSENDPSQWPRGLEHPFSLTPSDFSNEESGLSSKDSGTDNLSLTAGSNLTHIPHDALVSPPLPASSASDKKPISPPAGLARGLQEMETNLTKFDYEKVLEVAHQWLGEGAESGDLHLAAGMAAEERGATELARAHLGRAVVLDTTQIYARTILGRAYWHEGWTELAMAIWRSLPVEGPYDYGRHYHLALGHVAQGHVADALFAMRIALTGFFYDTRHIFIQRAYDRWRKSFVGETG